MTLEQWINSTLKNYQAKHKPKKSEVKHILDYLEAHPAERLQRASYPQVLAKSLAWTKTVNKKSKGLKQSGIVEEIHTFSNGFKYVRLVDQTAKQWEGLHMGHCVATYTESLGIYSLRDANNFPHATFEIEKKMLRQLSGKANGAVASQYVAMLPKCLEGLTCRPEVIESNFIHLPEKVSNFISEHFNTSPVEINKQKYISRTQSLKLIKAITAQSEDSLKVLLENHIKLTFDTIMQFAKVGCSLFTEELYNYYEDNFSDEDVMKFYITDNQDSKFLWSRIGFIALPEKIKNFIVENFQPVNIVECGKTSFLSETLELSLLNSFKCDDPEIFKFLLTKKHCREAILEFGKVGISTKLNYSESEILGMITNGFSQINRDFATFLETHFEDVTIYSFNNHYYVSSNFNTPIGAIKKDIKSKNSEFAYNILRSHFSEEALLTFIKNGAIDLSKHGEFALARAEKMNAGQLIVAILEKVEIPQQHIYNVLARACRNKRIDIIKAVIPFAKANKTESERCVFQSAEAGKEFMKVVIELFKTAGHPISVKPKDTYSYQWKPQNI